MMILLVCFSRRRVAVRAALAAASVIVASAAACQAAETVPVAVILPFGFVDTSGEVRDQSAEHRARVDRMVRDLAAAIGRAGTYRVVSAPPDLAACAPTDSACLLAGAKRSGINLIVAGALQKVSTMATQLWAAVFDAQDGRRLLYRQLTFRGDTEQAWDRATSFLAQEIEANPVRTR
jgi:hypothetical protein